jgi:IPT/TIG domain
MLMRRAFLLGSGATLLLPKYPGAAASSLESIRSVTPTVSGIVPATGSSKGGTSVTITGAGFINAPIVTFNGVAASSAAVIDNGIITCVTPAGNCGPASIVVGSPQSQSSPKGLFTYTLSEQIASLPLGSFLHLGNGHPAANVDGTAGFKADSYAIIQSFFTFPADDVYDLTIDAFWNVNVGYPGNSIELMVDSFPCHGVGATVVPSWWLLFVDNPSPAKPYTFTAPITAGPHFITIRLCTCQGPANSGRNGMHVERLRITAMGVGLRGEPSPATRDPFHYPGSSYSIWNTSIGFDAVWSAATDSDTRQLNGLSTSINAGSYSTNVYQGQLTDPSGSLTYTDATQNPILDSSTGRPNRSLFMRLPLGMKPSPSGPDDSGIAVGTIQNPRYFHTGFNGGVVAPNFVTIGHGKPIDCYNQNMIAADQYMIGIGIMRYREVMIDGLISHILQCGLSTDRIRISDTTCTNLAWPNRQCDYAGPFGQFTGQIPYGSTFGIPSTLDVMALGLSPGGLMLARAMQDYGVMHNISSPSQTNSIILVAENALEGTRQLSEMRAAFPALVPLLRIMRNQAPTSIQGGGTSRQPLRPGPLPNLPAIDFSAGPHSPATPSQMPRR